MKVSFERGEREEGKEGREGGRERKFYRTREAEPNGDHLTLKKKEKKEGK